MIFKVGRGNGEEECDNDDEEADDDNYNERDEEAEEKGRGVVHRGRRKRIRVLFWFTKFRNKSTLLAYFKQLGAIVKTDYLFGWQTDKYMKVYTRPALIKWMKQVIIKKRSI